MALRERGHFAPGPRPGRRPDLFFKGYSRFSFFEKQRIQSIIDMMYDIANDGSKFLRVCTLSVV